MQLYRFKTVPVKGLVCNKETEQAYYNYIKVFATV